MGTVKKRINVNVSDDDVNIVLQRIADTIGHIVVTSGDRGKPLEIGGKEKSLHLHKKAADFRFTSISLAEGYKQIKEKKLVIFSKGKKYEVIHHGEHSECKPHLHIGRYPNGTGVLFKVEGLTPETKKKYTLDSN